MKEVLFYHPMIRNYRVELFAEINNKFKTHFFFTDYDSHSLLKDFQHINNEVAESIHASKINDFTLLKKPKFFPNIYMFWKALKRLCFAKEKIVVLTNFISILSLTLFLVSSFLRKKIIFYDLNWIYPDQMIKTKIYFPVFKWLIKKQKYIITAGNYHKNFLRKNGAIKSEIVVAPTISEEFRGSLSELNKNGLILRDELGLKNKIIFLYIGRLVEYKGINIMIEAYKKVRNIDTTLIIGGSGEMENYVKYQSKHIGNDVKYVGPIPSTKRWLYYALSDVVILPSLFQKNKSVYCEGWGLVINEAFQVAKPVICTDACGAAREIVKDEIKDLYIRSGSVISLSNAINLLLSSNFKRKSLGEKGQQIIKKFNSRNQRKAFVEILDKVIKTK